MQKPAAFTILLIDDDTEDQDILILVLQEISPDITCYAEEHAATALEKLLTRKLKPDLIFLDLNMPVMNGMEFLSLIKKDDSLKEIPVIIVTTSALPSAKTAALDLGAKAFITKPDNYHDLKKSITQHLNAFTIQTL